MGCSSKNNLVAKCGAIIAESYTALSDRDTRNEDCNKRTPEWCILNMPLESCYYWSIEYLTIRKLDVWRWCGSINFSVKKYSAYKTEQRRFSCDGRTTTDGIKKKKTLASVASNWMILFKRWEVIRKDYTIRTCIYREIVIVRDYNCRMLDNVVLIIM